MLRRRRAEEIFGLLDKTGIADRYVDTFSSSQKMKLNHHHQHSWDLSPQDAAQLQERLRSYVRIEPLPEGALRLVAGVDASYSKGRIYAAVVVLDYQTGEPVEQGSSELPVTFPYLPGLLSFREAPAILAAMAELSKLPDVLLVDGHGLAHPRRFGLACHLGVVLDVPTLGCAKSSLVGEHGPLAEAVGSTAPLTEGAEVLGMAVRTRRNVKPVYVSVGHRIDLPSAVRVVLACVRGYRLPEPTRQAHLLAGRLRS